MFPRQIATDAHRPGVVGIGRRQPDDLVGIVIKLGCAFVGFACIFPYRAVGFVKEKGRVAGVFRIDINFARCNGIAHNTGATQLDFVLNRDAGALQPLQNHLPQHRAFRINFR